ncbi:MAG: NUDIX hydrolase [Terriglobia bacterium]
MAEQGEESKGYKILSSEVRFEGEVISLVVDQVEFRPGETGQRETIRHRGGVGIVPITAAGEVVLVRQYRHPIRGEMLEIPAGKLGRGEDPAACAVRELAEETGFVCDDPVKLAEFYTSPGYSNEMFYLYMGEGVREGPRPDRSHEERDLTVVVLPLGKAVAMISTGGIKDGKSIAGLTMTARSFEADR